MQGINFGKMRLCETETEILRNFNQKLSFILFNLAYEKSFGIKPKEKLSQEISFCVLLSQFKLFHWFLIEGAEASE